MEQPTLTLDDAVDIASTGDIWLFRGRSAADLAIRAVTNSPVNHVGMVVAIDDLPPLLWHAELGRSLPDVWTGQRQRGVQLNHLRQAVATWNTRYNQRAWVRQLQGTIQRHHEDRLMQTIARLDGRAFPTIPWNHQAVGDGTRASHSVGGDDLLRGARRHDLPGHGSAPESATGELV